MCKQIKNHFFVVLSFVVLLMCGNAMGVGGEDCSSAVVIASLPFSDTGDTTGYIDDYDATGYGTCPWSSTSPDVVYSYTPGSNIIVDIVLCDSMFDTKVFVYEDNCVSGSVIGCDDDGCGLQSQLLGLEFTGGHTYYIVVDGWGGYAGEYEIDVTGASSGACCNDSTGECSDNVADGNCEYRFHANTLCSELETSCGNGGGGDTCGLATEIVSLPYSDTGSTVGFTNDYYESCPGGDVDDAPDVVYYYVPANNMTVDISLCDSEYFTKLYVYADDCSGTHIGCDEAGCNTVTRSELLGLSFLAGHTYYIVVDGFGIQQGRYKIDIVSNETPVPTGACCNDDEASCQDDVSIIQCDGRFASDTSCSQMDPPCGDDWGLVCPGGTLFGQAVTNPVSMVSMVYSEDDGMSGLVYDDFSGLTNPICDIHWWGFQVDGNFDDCDEGNPVFDIGFYTDNNGEPDALACSYTVTATVVHTGYYLVYGNEWNELLYYSVDTLSPSCCALTDGWVSILGKGYPACWFMWASSGLPGEGTSWWEGDGLQDTDMSFCLTGDVELPDIRIEPLMFEAECGSGGTEVHTFRIYNDGNAQLAVNSLAGPAWVSLSPPLPYYIDPLTYVDVDVEFDCCACGKERLYVYSNDPDESPYPDGVGLEVNWVVGDFYGDCKVDIKDFAELTSQWGQDECDAPWWCDGVDINSSGEVDMVDFAKFAEFWLFEYSPCPM